MARQTSPESARERILTTATDLFYKQGYKATGINEVIEKSGVAKATFYSHFPSKDDLCLAYLKERNLDEVTEITRFVEQKKTARSKFMAVIESLEPWLIANQLRGCAFLNMVAEEPDTSSPLRKEGRRHYESLRRLVRKLTDELVASDKANYKGLDAARVTDEYMLILTGTIALCEIYNETWPINRGIKAVHNLLGKRRG